MEEEINHLRPWRKRTLQIISTDVWKKETEVVPLPQVAGHGSWDKSQAILTNKEGCILKPIQPPPRGDREVEFYQTVTTSSDKEVAQFVQFIPQFFGTCTKKDGKFMMIENLTKGMKMPCIVDIKIGAKTYGPDASTEKKEKSDAAYAGTKKPFGFSVLGMSVYMGEHKEEFKVLNKEFGKKLTKENIDDFLQVYFDGKNKTQKTIQIAQIFVRKLTEIQNFYSKQKQFHIFGSSLLFVYDAAALIDAAEENLEKAVVLKMIDFAHVFPAHGQADENYLKGLDNLIKLIKTFI